MSKLSPQILCTKADRDGEGVVPVDDIDTSTHHFLAQLSAQTDELRQGIEAARRERDEAAARLAALESRLADSTAALRALKLYTGEASNTGDGARESDTPNGEHGASLSIEEGILHVLRGTNGLLPVEIARGVQALGVPSSAASIRARLSRLRKDGTVVRDKESRYSLAYAGSEGTRNR